MLVFKYLQSIFNKKKKFYLNNYGNHTRDFTYIKDVCEIMYKLLKKKLNKTHQVYNICSNRPIKITKILRFIDLNFEKNLKFIKETFNVPMLKKLTEIITI